MLDAFARDVARDRWIFAFFCDFIDFVDVDNAAASAFDIAIGGVDEVQDDVFDVVADVASFGEARGIGHGKGDVENLGECLRKERLSGARGADEEYVGFPELDAVFGRAHNAFVMVMDGDRQNLLRIILLDDVFVEFRLDIFGLWHGELARHVLLKSPIDHLRISTNLIVSILDARFAYIHICPGNETLCIGAISIAK